MFAAFIMEHVCIEQDVPVTLLESTYFPSQCQQDIKVRQGRNL